MAEARPSIGSLSTGILNVFWLLALATGMYCSVQPEPSSILAFKERKVLTSYPVGNLDDRPRCSDSFSIVAPSGPSIQLCCEIDDNLLIYASDNPILTSSGCTNPWI
jgi:hypothetical protein